MYELKKIVKVFTSKFVRTGPSSYKQKNLPGRGLTKVEKHWYRVNLKRWKTSIIWGVYRPPAVMSG